MTDLEIRENFEKQYEKSIYRNSDSHDALRIAFIGGVESTIYRPEEEMYSEHFGCMMYRCKTEKCRVYTDEKNTYCDTHKEKLCGYCECPLKNDECINPRCKNYIE